MTGQDPTDGVGTAIAIVESNAYMTLATADASGTPWPTPVWFAHERFTEFVWVSRPTARHSRNIAVRAEVGITIFDSTVPVGDGQAAYMEAVAGAVGDAALDAALVTFNRRSEAQGGDAWTVADVTGEAPHRLYRATASAHFVLDAHDQRVPVDLSRS